MKREVIKGKMEHTKRRADFLFHNGEFKAQVVPSVKVYNRKKVGKINSKDIDDNS